MFNPFERKKNPSQASLERAQAAASEANIRLFNETIEEAKNCLKTPQFQGFKKRYELLRPKLVEELIYAPLPMDPAAAVIMLTNIRERLRSLDTFLGAVVDPATKAPIKPKAPKPEEAEKK